MTTVDLVKPAFISIPDEYDPNRTLGPEYGAVATLAGFPPDPEQQMCLDVSCALDKRGQPLIFDTVVIAPRQNLKTGFEKQRSLGKLFVDDRPLVIWSAHEFDTSRRACLDLERLIGSSDQLAARVALSARGNIATHGAIPEIKLRNGCTLAFKTRTSGGGVGLTGDDVFFDEAWAVQPEQIGAVLPIMLARPTSQVDFLSSACRPVSAYLWSLIQQGRKGGARRMFYVEWSTPPPEVVCDAGEGCDHGRDRVGCGCDKPEVIQLAHSAVTRGRITMEKIQDLRGKMPPAEYGREIMGWHDSTTVAEAPIPFELWTELEDESITMVSVGAYAVEVSLDRAWSSIGAAGPTGDGRIVLDLQRRDRGNGWIVDACVALKTAAAAPFVVDGGGPAARLIPDLEAAGCEVLVASARDVAAAAASIVDAAVQASIVHGPQQDLADQVAGAAKRNLGDGAFAIGRKLSVFDVDGFIAVMLAHWAAAIADLEQRSRPNIRFL